MPSSENLLSSNILVYLRAHPDSIALFFLYPDGRMIDKTSETIDINVEIVPYMIDITSNKVSTAIPAVEEDIWSGREGI